VIRQTPCGQRPGVRRNGTIVHPSLDGEGKREAARVVCLRRIQRPSTGGGGHTPIQRSAISRQTTGRQPYSCTREWSWRQEERIGTSVWSAPTGLLSLAWLKHGRHREVGRVTISAPTRTLGASESRQIGIRNQAVAPKLLFANGSAGNSLVGMRMMLTSMR
jgi:hypothetical protein